MPSDNYDYSHISGAATTVVKDQSGYLHTVTVNTTSAGAITIYDNTSAAGTVLAVIAASVPPQTFIYDLTLTTGLTVVTAGASDVTVSFS